VIIVDSCVWIDLLRDRDTPETQRLPAYCADRQLAIADLVIAEVLRGIAGERQFRETRDGLLLYPVLQVGGAETAIAAAALYRAVRARGHTVHSTVDCLIAAFCIANDHSLLTSDRDFLPFAHHFGLRLA
jgi:predicted nucleic acid-binding protein